jgi:hypothetical protein
MNAGARGIWRSKLERELSSMLPMPHRLSRAPLSMRLIPGRAEGAHTRSAGLSLCARGAALGMLLGWLAWGAGRTPLLALLLPVLLATRRSHGEATCAAGGYALGLMRHSAGFIAAWFEDDVLVGGAVLALCCSVAAVVWGAGWSAARNAATRMRRMVMAWLLALLPPCALAMPGHPLVAVGYLLPGSGWAGVVLSAATCLLAGALGPMASTRPVWRHALLGLAGILLLLSFQHAPAPPAAHVRTVQAMQTAWGALGGRETALTRIERMARADLPAGARVVVWPESILGRHGTGVDLVLRIELLAPSRQADRVQVVGIDLPAGEGRVRSAARAFYPDGGSATAWARQPVPLALWRPWSRRESFVADWHASNLLRLGQGDVAAVIFCYEEYLPLLWLLNEMGPAPSVYLVMANTWAASSAESPVIQGAHSRGMALLFGRDYLKADNRPARTPDRWPASLAE